MPRRTDGTKTGKRPRKKHGRESHGLHFAQRALTEYGSRAIDLRTTAGKELLAWREAILEDLGGAENVSAQRLALLDLAVKTNLLLDGLDVWLLSQDSIVNEKNRRVLDVVHQRMRLSDSLAKYLAMLGLEKVKPPPQDLTAYIETHYAEPDEE